MTNKDLLQPFNPKNLLVSLYQYQQTTIPSIAGLEFPPKKYIELNQFRQKIEEQRIGPHHQPYQAGRKKAIFYRSTFLGLSFLFVFLSVFMYTQSMNWSGTLFFVNYTATKFTLCAFTSLLAMIAFVMAATIKTEKEATNQMVQRAQSKIRSILAYKRAEYGTKNLSSFSQNFKKYILARQAYHDTLDKIRESKKITYALLEQISYTPGLEKQVIEKLFNEAILELNDKLHVLIQNFKKKIHEIY